MTFYLSYAGFNGSYTELNRSYEAWNGSYLTCSLSYAAFIDSYDQSLIFYGILVPIGNVLLVTFFEKRGFF